LLPSYDRTRLHCVILPPPSSLRCLQSTPPCGSSFLLPFAVCVCPPPSAGNTSPCVCSPTRPIRGRSSLDAQADKGRDTASPAEFPAGLSKFVGCAARRRTHAAGPATPP